VYEVPVTRRPERAIARLEKPAGSAMPLPFGGEQVAVRAPARLGDGGPQDGERRMIAPLTPVDLVLMAPPVSCYSAFVGAMSTRSRGVGSGSRAASSRMPKRR
jgi:hypothetical protein